MKFFILQFLCFSLVVCIAIRVCILVPASLVTRRAELSSKSNTVAGEHFTNLGQLLRYYLRFGFSLSCDRIWLVKGNETSGAEFET